MSLVQRAAMMGALAGWNAYQKNRGTPRLRATMTRRRKNRALVYRPRGRRATKKSWKARARRQVALPRNFASSKTTESVLPDLRSQNRNILGIQALIFLNRGNEINQRERDSAYISGMKINVAYRNLAALRVWVNWAVIFPKDKKIIGITEDDFFRDYTDQRAWNANDPGKTGLSWANASINPDEYVILSRGKFLLAPGNTTTSQFNIKDSDNDIERYVKIGRTFTWDGPIQAVDQQIFFVTWVASTQDPAGYNANVGMNWRLRNIIYFRDPKQA